MNIGDYVRFKDKRGNTYIRKVVDGYRESWYGCRVDVNANYVPYVSEKNIIKSSPNIVDLIETGDYVNGMKVFEVMKNPETDDIKEHLIVFVNEIKKELYTIYGNEIKSIVTHEQFESMEYKL